MRNGMRNGKKYEEFAAKYEYDALYELEKGFQKKENRIKIAKEFVSQMRHTFDKGRVECEQALDFDNGIDADLRDEKGFLNANIVSVSDFLFCYAPCEDPCEGMWWNSFNEYFGEWLYDVFCEIAYKIISDFVKAKIPDTGKKLTRYCHALELADEVSNFFPSLEDTYEILEKIGFDTEIACSDIINQKFNVEDALVELTHIPVLKKRTELKIPDNYADLYPEARAMSRHFVLHCGPTNSGKTYEAIKAMEKSESGVYLAPLRLLAEEMQETIEADGFACSLLTGEEEIANDEAVFVSSTAEMADLHTEYDCAVIDECQMCGDTARGGAWTAAILGLKAKTIHLCLAPQAKKIMIRLIEMCGDTYEITDHTRKTPLEVTNSVSFPKGIEKGDACIVFSRAHVHAVGAELQRRGFKVSIIYGALPADVRRKQAEMFAKGETDVAVATDAIGMGMNLPVKRIVFLESAKYDGVRSRNLKTDEIQQIAGRAGRYGMFESGLVTAAESVKWIRGALGRQASPVEDAVVAFPSSDEYESLSAALRVWQKTPVHDGFVKQDTQQMLRLALEAEQYFSRYDQVYSLASIPFDAENYDLLAAWKAGMISLSQGKIAPFVTEQINSLSYIRTDLRSCEAAYKKADLLYVFADRYGIEKRKEKLCNIRKKISDNIILILSNTKLTPKRCKYCGKTLPWNYPYGMCSECHSERYGSRSYSDSDDYGW